MRKKKAPERLGRDAWVDSKRNSEILGKRRGKITHGYKATHG